MEQVEKKNSALLVIDVQQGLFERSTPIYQGEQMLENINRLVDQAHQQGVQVICFQHSNDKILVKGTREWEFHQAINPQPGDLHFHKLHGDAFVETPLQESLLSQNITRIFVTGLVTQGCIRSTCLGGLKRGYEVILVSDAHSTYTKPAKQTIEKWQAEIEKAGATLIPANEIVF